MPLLWKLKVPVRKKIVLCLLLSSGLFVITAAILRLHFSLVEHPSALTINRWGVRETVVGVLSVNIPVLRPLFDKSFWKAGYKVSSRSGGSQSVKRSQGPGVGPYELAPSVKTEDARSDIEGRRSYSTTEEYVSPKGSQRDVVIETTVQIQHSAAGLTKIGDGNQSGWDHNGHGNHVAIGSNNRQSQ